MTAQTLEAIKYQKGTLQIIDQLLLPFKTEYVAIDGVESGFEAIKSMKVCNIYSKKNTKLIG
jgi:methylthioribose-1-phosphate isomerase